MNRLLFGLCLAFVWTVDVQAQRFVASADTLAGLRAYPLPSNLTNVWVSGRLAAGDGFEGVFTWTSGSTASTNLGTVFHSVNSGAPSGRWLRQYKGPLNAMWFGAKGDGSNQTDPIKNAYDSIPKNAGGDIFFPAGNYSFNLAVVDKNIGLIFDSFIKEDSGTLAIVSNIITAADITLPIITIGNGTDFAKGCRIIGGTFTGNGSAGVLLRMAGGAYECTIEGAQFYGARTNIWVQGHGTVPCSLNTFNNGSCLAANTADSRGFYVAAPDAGTGYTTVTRFNNFHFNSQTGGSNNRMGELDGAHITWTSTYADFVTNSAIRFSRSAGVNVFDPVIYCANVVFDGSSTYPIIEDNYGAAQRISAVLQGSYTFNGQAIMQDGTVLTEEACQSAVYPAGQIFNPYMRGAVKLMPVASTITNRNWHILETDAVDTTILRLAATNGTLEIAGQTNITLATGDGIGTNKLIYLQPGMVSITNSWPSISSFKVYGAGSGVYSDTNAPTVRIFTSSATNTVRSALHLDSYQNTPAFPISLDFGLMNSTNGESTSRIIHFANVATNRASSLQLQTHTTIADVWNPGLKIGTFGGVSIGGTNETADAILDLQDTSRGFGTPVLSTVARDLLTPRDGLQIYNSTVVAVRPGISADKTRS